MNPVQIIGAGLAGLSAAIHLAQEGIPCHLISPQPSERAQSVLAEGGINAVLNTMGEADEIQNHFEDTIRGGCYLADEKAVLGLVKEAPQIVRWLRNLLVPFNLEGGEIVQRNFGGQKKKRTAYAKSSTGKVLMTALIDEARKYEAAGLITRYSHHELTELILSERQECEGVIIRDRYRNEYLAMRGIVVLASGGMNGLFPYRTTGTTTNSANVTAKVFEQGMKLANLEMIQYHPTTIGISGKRCLISEAARGEGGRLFVMESGKPRYFMEEKYPELKNLMPRDVISKEMVMTKKQVYLDMTGLTDAVWRDRLSDLRQEIMQYLLLDPKKDPIPVEPGIHYFMGGIWVDENHRTSIGDAYAIGECCMQYHGANRLGGNSMLGAIYGGKKAAQDIVQRYGKENYHTDTAPERVRAKGSVETPRISEKIGSCLYRGMGIVRTEDEIQKSLRELEELLNSERVSETDENRIYLGIALLRLASLRKESRGAHGRADYPKTLEEYKKMTVVTRKGCDINAGFI